MGKLGVKKTAALAAACVLALAGCPTEGEGGSEALAQTFTVTLDQQGGRGGTSSVKAALGSPMPSITPPTRSGYIFSGYWLGTNGSGEQYYTESGESAREWDIVRNAVLYAYWTGGTPAVRTFTVSFDLNDEGAETPPDALSVAEGGQITLPAVSRQGYRFDGWYTEEGDRAGGAGEPYTPEASLTLYAHWTEGGGTDPEASTINLTDSTCTGAGITYADGVFTISGGEVSVSGTTTSSRIIVNGAAVVTLDGASIDLSGAAGSLSPLDLSSGANVTLVLSGWNTLTAAGGAAGVHVSEGRTLTITSVDGDTQTSGTLTATGGTTNGSGAGIGGSIGEPGGAITIAGGTVIAASGNSDTGTTWGAGAGIGGGGDWDSNSPTRGGSGGGGNAGTITITGGAVTATGEKNGAGIGGGAYAANTSGSITISGGTVHATGNGGGAGIGGGYIMGSGGTITITGGTVHATGRDNGAGIGGGGHKGNSGTISITGGTGSATAIQITEGMAVGCSVGYGGHGVNAGTYDGTFTDKAGNNDWPAPTNLGDPENRYEW